MNHSINYEVKILTLYTLQTLGQIGPAIYTVVKGTYLTGRIISTLANFMFRPQIDVAKFLIKITFGNDSYESNLCSN